LVVGFVGVDVFDERVLAPNEFRSSGLGEVVGKEIAGVVELIEGEARVVDNSSEVEGAGGLVESPERLGKVGVKFEEGSEKVLWDFLS
jgi:hypothetical protein